MRRIGFAAACFAAPLAAYRGWGQYTLALALKNAESGGMGETSPDVVTVAVNGIRMILGLPVGDYYEARRSQFYTACSDMLHQYLTRDGTLSMIGQGVVVTGLILALFFAAWLVAGQRGLQVRIGLFALFSTLCFLGYNLMLAPQLRVYLQALPGRAAGGLQSVCVHLLHRLVPHCVGTGGAGAAPRPPAGLAGPRGCAGAGGGDAAAG